MARVSKKEHNINKIYSAALEMLADGGFHKSPMSLLAKRAKVSVGSIYLYFPSKDKLVLSLFEYVRDHMGEWVVKDFKYSASVPERYDALFLNLCHYYLENKNHFVFMDQFALSHYNQSALAALSTNLAKAFFGFYQDAIRTHTIKNIRLETLLSLTHGSIISLLKKHHMGFMKLDEKTILELKDCVWDGIKSA
jgi:AcrR family transcriptional regulator